MKSSKVNLVGRLQNWMDSISGQTFLNYAYSWGASIVILGALFKLTHMPLANLMLYIGMGTEVLVFFISAFDRPFDVKEMEKEETPCVSEEEEMEEESQSPVPTVPAGNVEAGTGSPVIGNEWVAQPADPSVNPEMEEASRQYVEKLRLLTETLDKVEKQSARLTTESEEMTNLNRTLTGINTVYELQLKGVSQQIGSIEQINEQTRLMAKQIEDLNAIYARMIKALTVNMRNAAGKADL